MTPAVALTSQSLDPVQAFADAPADFSAATLVYTGTDATDNKVNVGTVGGSITTPSSFELTNGQTDASKVVYDGYKVVFKESQGTQYLDDLTGAAAGTYQAFAESSTAAGTYSPACTTTFVVSAADPGQGGTETDKTSLDDVFTTFSYNNTALTNGFVITVPSGKTWSGNGGIQEAYQNGVVVKVAGVYADTTGNDWDLALTLNVTNPASYNTGVMTLTPGSANTEYSGSVEVPFTVNYEIGADQVTVGNATVAYNGTVQEPTVTVANPATGKDFAQGVDYTVSYQSVNANTQIATDISGKPSNAGTYNVVVNYNGQKIVADTQFVIDEQNIDPAENSIIKIADIEDITYTGSEIATPALSITADYGAAGKQTLQAGRDYTVEVIDGNSDVTKIENVGQYTIKITGEGNYTDTTSVDFEVVAASLADATAVCTNQDKLVIGANGQVAVAPTFDVTYKGVTLTPNVDYEVGSLPNQQGTEVPVVLTGKGNFAGTSLTAYVSIARSIKDAQVKGGSIPDQTWGEGKWDEPAFELTYNNDPLTLNVDYTVDYGPNEGAGPNAGTITVTGIGKWTGTKVITYTIEGQEVAISNIKPKKNAVYNGTIQNAADYVTFDVTYTDADGETVTVDKADYKATVKTSADFKDARSYGVQITLTGGKYYVNTPATTTLEIDPANIDDLNFETTADQYLITWDNEGKKEVAAQPEFTVMVNGAPYTLVEGTDYTLTPAKDSTNLSTPGNYKATLKADGNFTGDAQVAFKVRKDINILYVPAIDAVTYNGQAQTPAYKVFQNNGAGNQTAVAPSETANTGVVSNNYTVSWNNNINAGTGQLVLTGVGNTYAGTKTVDFTINKAAATIAVADIADVTYTGSAIMPEPKATITAGTQTVASTFAYSYANNVNAGTATVTVVPTGVGENYDVAATTKTFKINAANMSAVAYSGDTKVAVNKQPTIKLTYNGKELVAGTDYDVTETPVTSKAGKATLKVTGKGNFTGVKTIDITVEDASTPVNPDKPTTTEGWKQNATGWWYETGEGSYVTSAWKQINGNWYYFNKSGYMMTGWQKINGTWYYLNKKGEGTEGAMVSNAWKKINGTWYHFAKSGAMQTGWQKINGAWYYMAASGAMQTGWVKDGGTWYYLLTAAEGTEGKMVSNQWKQINGSWFYFYASGAMAANAWVGNYYVDANGYWVR